MAQLCNKYINISPLALRREVMSVMLNAVDINCTFKVTSLYLFFDISLSYKIKKLFILCTSRYRQIVSNQTY